MKIEVLEYLRCPACKGSFELTAEKQEDSKVLLGKLFCQQCQKSYEIRHNLPNLVHPEPQKLPEIDAKFLKQYERLASSYDRILRLLFLLSGMWEPRARRRDLVDPLELRPGDWVLEVGTRSGKRLLKHNPLFANKPPKELVPDGVRDFQLRWIWRGMFYVMEFKKLS